MKLILVRNVVGRLLESFSLPTIGNCRVQRQADAQEENNPKGKSRNIY